MAARSMPHRSSDSPQPCMECICVCDPSSPPLRASERGVSVEESCGDEVVRAQHCDKRQQTWRRNGKTAVAIRSAAKVENQNELITHSVVTPPPIPNPRSSHHRHRQWQCPNPSFPTIDSEMATVVVFYQSVSKIWLQVISVSCFAVNKRAHFISLFTGM